MEASGDGGELDRVFMPIERDPILHKIIQKAFIFAG
jgi:hypothetical protein